MGFLYCMCESALASTSGVKRIIRLQGEHMLHYPSTKLTKPVQYPQKPLDKSSFTLTYKPHAFTNGLIYIYICECEGVYCFPMSSI